MSRWAITNEHDRKKREAHNAKRQLKWDADDKRAKEADKMLKNAYVQTMATYGIDVA